MTRRNKKIPFKPYHDKQSMLFPPSIDELVPAGHPVRIVDGIIDKVDIQSILDTYPGGGSSGYHPRILLKVLVYAYLRNIYSNRQIEESLKENIHFMWLSGMSKPDHNTINRFRGKRLDGNLKEIFGSVVEMLATEVYLSIKEVYIDGTKMEANANRYTFVWGNAIETQKEKIRQQLEEIWGHVQSVYEQGKDLPPNFISRYFPPVKPWIPALGELNLTWTLGSTTEILPYSDPRDDGTYNSAVIRLKESSFDDRSTTFNALNMFHEALHAKLIAEFYDQVGSTDFDKLYAYYRGFGFKNIDKQQEEEMLNLYLTDIAIGLKNFDESQGIFNDLDEYKAAIRYDISVEVFGLSYSTDDHASYLKILIKSTTNCN